jgi:hypothetical protein
MPLMDELESEAKEDPSLREDHKIDVRLAILLLLLLIIIIIIIIIIIASSSSSSAAAFTSCSVYSHPGV